MANNKRPLISAKNRDIVGAARETSNFANQGHDLTFVGGYSDKRREIDADLARGRTPTVGLDIRCQYVTTEKPNGRKDYSKVMQFQAMGYKFVEFDNPPPGISIPTHAFKTADGHVGVGDVQLMYCDAATAARNEAQGRSAIDEASAEDTTSQALHSAGREVGGRRTDMTEATLEQRTEVTRG